MRNQGIKLYKYGIKLIGIIVSDEDLKKHSKRFFYYAALYFTKDDLTYVSTSIVVFVLGVIEITTSSNY